ncbi:LytTR family DNA-binding domain-containing protein [Paenibacillus sp. FSL R10-2734]|uniref:LytR/AlgR family response regulator transcription factor n=1 Tax=Paenibacillus sp. FSL R10-2734 TaxID=2954691 RepID=UPI0030DD248D
MLHIAVCDDDEKMLQQLKDFFLEFSKKSTNTFYVQYFPSGEELLYYYSLPGRYTFHLIFMDIEMSGISGLDTVLKIRAQPDYNVQIIFLADSPEYMIDSFNVQPFYYQLKPLLYETFHALLQRAFVYINTAVYPRIKLKTTDGEVILQTFEVISLVKVDKSHVKITTLDQVIYSSITLTQLSERLDINFYQIHKSAIVNMRHIKKFTSSTVVMTNKDILPLGRLYKKDVIEVHTSTLCEPTLQRV